MSPRKKEQNEQVRQARKQEILDAALSVYVRLGYNGTDMDIVAAEAGLAKGLMYYYFKTKRELFRAMFEDVMEKAMSFHHQFAAECAGLGPVEWLAAYTWQMFGLAERDPRVIQFSMRLPFDAHAVFGPDQWQEGMKRSAVHLEAIAAAIGKGVEQGDIRRVDPVFAANCFWTVYVANLFQFTRMIGAEAAGQQSSSQGEGSSMAEAARQVAAFCFGGLGVTEERWRPALSRAMESMGDERGVAEE
jgi:AcrR family transcriptional regulator